MFVCVSIAPYSRSTFDFSMNARITVEASDAAGEGKAEIFHLDPKQCSNITFSCNCIPYPVRNFLKLLNEMVNSVKQNPGSDETKWYLPRNLRQWAMALLDDLAAWYGDRNFSPSIIIQNL